MKRRVLLKLSGIYVIGTPWLPRISFKFVNREQWQEWLQILLRNFEIECEYDLFYPSTLPDEKMPDFVKTNNKFYFYNQHQFCFTVFEKSHDVLGLLELAVPFWKKEPSGVWKKIANLSLFQLEALARTSEDLEKFGAIKRRGYLLPQAHQPSGGYITANGSLSFISKVQENGVTTSINVFDKEKIIWQDTFRSKFGLTAQV